MLRLTTLATACLAACYAPDVQDCTVTCNAADDCADDQVCTRGFCVASSEVMCDGSADEKVPLRVDIDGDGKVIVTNIGTCSANDASRENCSWMVALGTRLQLQALAYGDKQLDGWTGGCAGQDASCVLTAREPITVGASFE